MTKDEMKNRISMALKDLILQQGFETICKDLAISEHDREHNDYELTEVYKKVEQLEKENADLKEQNKGLKTVKIPQLERKIASIRGCHSVDVKKLNARTEQVEILKKEISELRKEIKNNEDLAAVAYMQGAESQKKKTDKQLIKAKEIIKKFSDFVNNKAEYDPEHPQEYADLRYELCEQAEQFLRDNDIDNAIQQANKSLNLDKIAEEIEQDFMRQRTCMTGNEKGGLRMQSTDTNLKIYITEAAREVLFKKMQQVNDTRDLLSASNLEQICLGKTHLSDSAYGQIRRLLKQEFKQWLNEQYNDSLRRCKND